MTTLKTEAKPSKTETGALRRGFKAEAERTALDYRKRLGLHAYDPLPAEDLAHHLGIRILTPADIPGMTTELLDILLVKGKDKWSAAIYKREDKRYIIHNPTHVPGRRESNLMHELAHAHCGHALSSLETAIIGSIIPLRKYDEGQEAEAECLGGVLQLPKDALMHHFCFGGKTPAEIAELFNASLNMVNFRLGKSGVKVIHSRLR